MSFGKLVVSVRKAEIKQFYEMTGDLTPEETAEKVKAASKPVLADDCRNIFRNTMNLQEDLLLKLFPIFKNASPGIENKIDIFFIQTLPVPPPIVRPANMVHGRISEHEKTNIYKLIIMKNFQLKAVIENVKEITTIGTESTITAESRKMYDVMQGENKYEKLYNAWQELQETINLTLDSQGKDLRHANAGLKQIIEKKTGLIRMHMMGKRVDFAARTVITPDPNINVDEIGVPEVFAKKLSYPIPVTTWNVNDLREMVINGPDIHPGANYIENANGYRVIVPSDNEAKRISLAKLLLTPNEKGGMKIVHRHLINGDVLLLNRQPSLHRPSMQAHKARILRGEKTFRLHYSNCKAYNADFDGDEMNAHFPQNELGRSESYHLANVANNYLVPKDGTPLGGLIQDHMISGVRMSMRGKFFNREDYHQLVFQGLSHIRGNIKLLPPTIIKPMRLWSGKQVFSTIIINLIPAKKPLINLTSTAKIGGAAWETTKRTGHVGDRSMCESQVYIREGELLVGVLDKMHYGSTPYSLVHCMYELYGGECATQLLSSLAKCFTIFLQWDGFTLGVRDILVVPAADAKRKQIIEESRKIGRSVTATTLNLPLDTPADVLSEKLNEAYSADVNFRAILDRGYKSALNEYTNAINKVCIPTGLLSRFPENNLQLMVTSGAKGSTVNTMQISSLLGQIELEGKRPPLMISGKSLPSFSEFETSPKSGGFIDGRFMTGIQPQDFFFHCMAGREGLIDTAVKTSRSGYLQRCLIKHLEGISVQYDQTVRDSDNSVIQFLYGEDGLDISQSQFLKTKQLKFLLSNADSIVDPELLARIDDDPEMSEKLMKYKKKIRAWLKKNRNLIGEKHVSPFQQFSKDARDEVHTKKPNKVQKVNGRRKIDNKVIGMWPEKCDEYTKKFKRRPDPVISKFSSSNYFGAISEYLEALTAVLVNEIPEKREKIEQMMFMKSVKSLVVPGEPVGLLAAQSIGEPSTQMTLNTFHFAGRGEMNVTLGIPRLREILMVASKKIKTPSMDIPFRAELENPADIADRTRLRMAKVTLADVLQNINVRAKLKLFPNRCWEYVLRFEFLPRDAYADKFCVRPKQIMKYVTTTFFRTLFKAIVRAAREKNSIVDIDDKKKGKGRQKQSGEEDADGADHQIDEQEPAETSRIDRDADDSSDDDDVPDDADATADKLKDKQADENDYDEEDGDEAVKHDSDSDNENDGEEKGDGEGSETSSSDDDDDDDDKKKVISENEFAENFTSDKKHHLWCEIVLNLDMKFRSVDFSTLLKTIAAKSVIWETPNIRRAITYTDNNELMLKTDGINIIEMFKHNDILNLNRLYTNDIHAVAGTYGIEAARRVIVKEVQNVFQVYGITVDPRHLFLVADYMTFDGTIKAFNRKGMESSSSPLQQISFESSLTFLRAAAVTGRNDRLESPSSRLMVGQPCKSGTGAFSLLVDYNSLFKN